MEKVLGFESNLRKGRMLEEAVRERLAELLPKYKVVMTQQDNSSLEREEYSLIDVVVLAGTRPVLGIECKWGDEILYCCQAVNGWPSDYNVVLNSTSLHKYKEAEFPVYVLNVNHWCHKAMVADLHTILSSPNDSGRWIKYSGVVRYNVDARGWIVYEADWTVRTIVADVVRREGLC